MMRSRGRDVIGKVIVSEETGRKFGTVGDINFIADTGELLNIVLVEPTKHIGDLTLERDESSRLPPLPHQTTSSHRVRAAIPLIVTYHPAYLLRSPTEKAKAWQDLCFAIDAMQKL